MRNVSGQAIHSQDLIFENIGRGTETHQFEQLLPPKVVAKILGVNVKFVYDRISERKLPAERVGVRSLRIRPSDLRAFLASND